MSESDRDTRPVALVTGGAKRLGRATAIELAWRGFDVVLTASSSMQAARDTAAECDTIRQQTHGGERGGSRVVGPLDLSDLDEVDKAAAQLALELGRLDVLVHNASSYEQTPLETVSADEALRAYAVNAAAPLLLTRHLIHLLRQTGAKRTGGAAIVTMLDIHALGATGLPRSKNFAAYSMSKAALADLTRSLARELAPLVRVNGLALGAALWPETGHESDAASQAAYLKSVPLGRQVNAEEVAKTVAFLAVDATGMTGQIIKLDGGRTLL